MRVLFLATEDWFFASHYRPLARAARQAGFEVAVAARMRDHRAAIEAEGFRAVPLDAERRQFGPLALLAAIRRTAAMLRAERPDLLYMIALRPMILGGIAARLAGVPRRVYMLTGLGVVGASQGLPARLVRGLARVLLRGPLGGPGAHYVFENPDDPAIFGLRPDDPRVTVIGGGGVDPASYQPAPLPPQPPLRVAVVTRMLWSKGVDLAVEAVRRARARGAEVELSLYGAPDPSNPRALTRETLQAWGQEPGIAWRGPTSKIPAVWAEHHVCLLATRGGEGLPRALLEAAACGRGIVATDVPGCRTLVRDGVEGLLGAPGDPEPLAEALARLAADPALVARMGEAARARVLDAFTERHAMEATAALLRRLAGQP